MTKIQIFTTEDSFPYEVTGRKRNETSERHEYKESRSGNNANVVSVADALRNDRVLAEFLVLNQGYTTPTAWMEFHFNNEQPKLNAIGPISKETLYQEMFPSTEEEIRICMRWLRSNSESDQTIKEIRDRCL